MRQFVISSEKQSEVVTRGVKSGQLTTGETRHLEKEQRKIEADKLQAKSNGKVTPAERAKLRKEQNKASRDIYRTKHNDRTAKPKSQEPAQQPPAQEQPPQQ